ncbi:MAG: S8 family serine peptidase, partial [Parvibaculales bacterium]
MRTLLFHFSRLWTALILVTFAGCGSGGNTIDVSLTSTGSQAQAQSTKEADSATQFVENSQYIGQMGLGMMKTAAAYSQGGSGKDVAIGFVDTALDNTHEEFSDGRIIFHDKTAYEETERTAEHQQHATKVVSLAAGSRLAGENMHGVAYEADIAMWELLLKDNGYLKLNANILEKAYTALGNAGSDIINNSWATSLVFQPEKISASQDFLKWYFGDALEVMKQANIIYVWASGNGGEAEVKRTAALPLLFPELSNKMLIVTAVNAEGEIDSISNHCGSLANWCISAPGGYDERMVTA